MVCNGSLLSLSKSGNYNSGLFVQSNGRDLVEVSYENYVYGLMDGKVLKIMIGLPRMLFLLYLFNLNWIEFLLFNLTRPNTHPSQKALSGKDNCLLFSTVKVRLCVSQIQTRYLDVTRSLLSVLEPS